MVISCWVEQRWSVCTTHRIEEQKKMRTIACLARNKKKNENAQTNEAKRRQEWWWKSATKRQAIKTTAETRFYFICKCERTPSGHASNWKTKNEMRNRFSVNAIQWMRWLLCCRTFDKQFDVVINHFNELIAISDFDWMQNKERKNKNILLFLISALQKCVKSFQQKIASVSSVDLRRVYSFCSVLAVIQ